MNPTATAAPVVTLKKLSYNSRLSEETNAFWAVVCVDGKPVFTAKNDGHGGCDHHEPLTYDDAGRKTMADAMAVLKAHVATLSDDTSHGFSYRPSVETLVGDALEALLVERSRARQLAKITRDMLTVVHFSKADKPGVFIAKFKQPLVGDYAVRARGVVAERYPGVTIHTTADAVVAALTPKL